MALRKLVIAGLLGIMGSIAAPATASADWLFTPFIGGNWGSSISFDGGDFEDEFEKRLNFGASLGWMGAGIAGFEIDFGYSPNFFENTVGDENFGFGESNVTTLMGNLILGVPIGGQRGPGIRPYAAGGLGLIKSNIGGADDLFEVDSTDWGFNVGGGVNAFITDNFGIRGDVRYFRSLEDNEPDDEFDVALSDFRFWRWTVGATFRFGNQ
jgi:opacity protein-like surface antigen